MKLSILIVSYGTRELTLACLESVYTQTAGVDFEVVVVDNASPDGSADAIRQRYPRVTLLALTENVGFARANNLAAKVASGEYLLLLNPDTVILDGAIQKALAFAEVRPNAAVIGGRTYFGDRSLNDNSCHGRPTPWSMVCKGLGLSSLWRRSLWFNSESLGSWRRDTVREVDAVTGCFLLIRKAVWDELGGFDERFVMYGEDTDLCMRAWKAGHRCVICPDAQLIHYGGRSEKVRADKMVRLFMAKARLIEKHWDQRWVWFGVMMLDLWACDRMIVLGMLRWLRPSLTPAYGAWREIWLRRAEYRVTTPTGRQTREVSCG